MTSGAPQDGPLLAGSVAVVTGGASGIGRAICLRFAAAGARAVVVADVQPHPREGGTETTELVREAGAESAFVTSDVRDPAQAEAAVAAADQYGGVDVLVTAAGIIRQGPALEITEADYDAIMDVNAKGTFFTAQAAARRMSRRGHGSIVLISSTAGLKGSPDIAAYAMSKGAVRLLAYALAAELGPAGVRVNALHPGLTSTEMTRTDLKRIDTDAPSQTRIPLSRPSEGRGSGRTVGQPGDLADAALYLASPMASFVHGSSLVVDGGSTWAS